MSVLKPDARITTSQMPKFGAGQYGAEISALMQSSPDDWLREIYQAKAGIYPNARSPPRLPMVSPPERDCARDYEDCFRPL